LAGVLYLFLYRIWFDFGHQQLGGCEKIEKKRGLSKLMTVSELFPALRNLPRADKLRVVQFLIAELAHEEEPDLQPGAIYTVWSPLDSYEAVRKLAQLLESE
jgi:hypothetical protein